MFEVLSNLNHKALNAAPSRARYTGACEKGERDEEGEPARLTRAPAHRKLESQIVLPPPPKLGDAPREGCACERADPPRGACFPSEQGLEQVKVKVNYGFSSLHTCVALIPLRASIDVSAAHARASGPGA